MLFLPSLLPDIAQEAAIRLADMPRMISGEAAYATMHVYPSPENTALAWAFFIMLLLTIAVISACIIALRGGPGAATPEQLLIEEVMRDQEKWAEGKVEPGPQPWEKTADWWKMDG